MGVFKNEVGRPSNETIKKRNIFKGICVLLIIVVICLIAYILNDKGIFNNEESNNKTTTKRSVETFDKSQIVTKKHDDDNFVDVYVYGKKLNFEGALGVLRVEVIEDAAVIEIGTISGPFLFIVNKSGEVLYSAVQDGGYLYCPKEKTSECYDFKVSDNKIKFYKDSLGQDKLRVCSADDNFEALVEYELTYENGKVTEKEINKITAKEYIEKHN